MLPLKGCKIRSEVRWPNYSTKFTGVCRDISSVVRQMLVCNLKVLRLAHSSHGGGVHRKRFAPKSQKPIAKAIAVLLDST
jgi:hypothetical protein